MIKTINIDEKLVTVIKNLGIRNFSKFVTDLIINKIYTEKNLEEIINNNIKNEKKNNR